MDDKLMTDVGENYEYIRTIINNKIEIAKIDISVVTSKALGYTILALLFLGMLGLFIASLLVALAVALAGLTGSWIYGILLASASLIIVSILIFLLRRPLIFKPIANIFYTLIANEE